ncbi:hypothetical protein [Actinomadura sp. WAC 06369]|uniref:hypothetical protein n=1 Tax=Actinomadura sp. WAC 06369 TaxID=2203193 RepID=UPI000F7BA2F7|nr:hypothetical protein [Actinomadura sp. WAC 06369]
MIKDSEYEVLPDGITIDSGIAENVPRYRRLASHWRGTGEVKGLDGEFKLPYFYRAVSNEAPRVWDGAPEEEVRLFEDFRIIDGAPRSGTGTFVAIRLSPDVSSPRLWVYDPRIGPLELDYLGYLEALSLAKGVHGWQYLYADVKLGGVDFCRTVEGVRRCTFLGSFRSTTAPAWSNGSRPGAFSEQVA